MDKELRELLRASAQLKGYAEGAGIKPDTPERDLILKLVDLTGRLTDALQNTHDRLAETETAIDSIRGEIDEINEDLDGAYDGVMENTMRLDKLEGADEEDSENASDPEEMQRVLQRLHDEIDEDFFDDDDVDDPDFFEIECPACGEDVLIDFDDIEEERGIICPNCGETIELEIDCGCDDEE